MKIFKKYSHIIEEYTLNVLFSIMLFLSGIYIPLFGTVFSLFSSLPTLVVYLRYGRLYGISLPLIVTLLIYIITTNYTLSFTFLIEFGILAIILSEVLMRKIGIGKTVFYTTIVFSAFIIFTFVMLSIKSDKGIWFVTTDYINNNLKELSSIHQLLGFNIGEKELIREYSKKIVDILIKFLPSFIITGTAIIIWLNILVIKRIFKNDINSLSHLGRLVEWRTPDHLIWAIILCGIILILNIKYLRDITLNVIIILLTVYFFQGMAIVSYFFEVKKIPLFLRSMGYLLIIIQQFLLIIIVGLGIFDLWVDFRKFLKPADSSTI